MELINIGKLVNTHGIKGEVKILSDFEYKNDIFKIGNSIYINDNKYIIKSYRKHQIYDMVILDKIDSIELAEQLKGYSVFINKLDYSFDGYLLTDLINLDVYDENLLYKGKIIDIQKGIKYDFLVIDGEKRHLVPNTDIFVKSIDMNERKVIINYIKGLDNED